MKREPNAVTLDFHFTLAYLCGGRGRGVLYREFLAEHGLEAETWEHQVIYDVFEFYGAAYILDASPRRELEFWTQFALRLFERTGVADAADLAGVHALRIRDIFGSRHFCVYPEVKTVLSELNRRRIPLAIVSNWPAGLAKLCHELGILGHFDEVLASAEVGHEKPAPEIFQEACRRLGRQPAEVLHVGDSIEADIKGATWAGLKAVLIDRTGSGTGAETAAIPSLDGILEMVGD